MKRQHTICFSDTIEGRNATAVFEKLGRKKSSVIINLMDCYLGLVSEKPLMELTEDDYNRIATKLLNMKERFLFVNPYPNYPFPYMGMYPSMPQPTQTYTDHTAVNEGTLKKAKDCERTFQGEVQQSITENLDRSTYDQDNTDAFDVSPQKNESENNDALLSDLQNFGIPPI